MNDSHQRLSSRTTRADVLRHTLCPSQKKVQFEREKLEKSSEQVGFHMRSWKMNTKNTYLNEHKLETGTGRFYSKFRSM